MVQHHDFSSLQLPLLLDAQASKLMNLWCEGVCVLIDLANRLVGKRLSLMKL